MPAPRNDAPVDYALIGGGIMSATLALLLSELDPDATIHVYERLGETAQESSDPWRNAGTGHAALCELNYTPERSDGSIDITKAIAINEQFKASRELWDFLADSGSLPAGTPFLSPVPHMNLVIGAENVDYLRRRHAALSAHPNFADMRFTEDRSVIADWAPLLMDGRDSAEPVAATRSDAGTDVDFGSLTRSMFEAAKKRGVVVHTSVEVSSVRRSGKGWNLKVRDNRWNPLGERSTARARFVFVGAGGGALRLLQSTGIPEVRGFAGFPISGQFLRTFDPELVARHQAKVYGKADGGAPPMSVPHLDTRVVDGRTALMFGPFAGFSFKFLRFGSPLDALKTIRPGNVLPLLAVGRDNLDLVKYLVTELAATPSAKLRALQKFFPRAERGEWTMITAGQRVQMIKPDPKRTGSLQFGTEVITSADGSVAGLLGASPGASTAAYAMAQVVERCFGQAHPDWVARLREIMPSLARADADPHDAKPAGPV